MRATSADLSIANLSNADLTDSVGTPDDTTSAIWSNTICPAYGWPTQAPPFRLPIVDSANPAQLPNNQSQS